MDSLSPILGPDGQPLQRAVPAARPGLDPVNQNWYWWVKNLHDHFINPDNIPLETYEQMLETDETCFSGIEFLKMSALARLGDYTHENDEIQEFVRENLVRMEGTFLAACDEILSATSYGFSVTEKIFRPEGNRIWLRGLQTLHPASITFDLWRDGWLKNRLKTIYQFRYGDRETEIPVQKCVVFSHAGSFGNIYGKSRLKRAYAPWFIKRIILKAWGLTCERYGAPYTIAHSDTQGKVTVDGVQLDAVDYITRVLDSLSAKGSAVFDTNTTVDLKYAPRGFGEDFENLVAYCNKMIYRAIGLPSLIADHGDTGSYSLGKQHFKLFTLILERLLHDLIETLVEQLVRPLIEINFGAKEHYGDFSVENFEAEDEKLVAEVLEVLARTGVVDTTRLDDMNWMRERMGLPLLEQEDIEPSLPPIPRPDAIPPEDDQAADQAEELEDEERFCFSLAAHRRRRRARAAGRWRSQMTHADRQMREILLAGVSSQG